MGSVAAYLRRRLTAQRGGGGSAFSVSFTGLTDGEARIGDHASIGYTETPTSASETVKWSNSANPADAATYGTGANPTDITAGDEGRLWLHVTDGGETVSRSAPIRYAPGTASSIADGQTATVDDTVLNIAATASGANLTFAYSLIGAPAGMTTNASTGGIGGTVTEVFDGTVTLRATDQYGRTYDDPFTFTSSLRAQATAANGLGPFSFTIDDEAVVINFVPDFTANGNTLSYAITGLPAGGVDDGDGTSSGTAVQPASSGSVVCTATDEYGRQTTSTATVTTALRAQATGGTDLDLSFVAGTGGSQDLLANWTTSGNTLTLVSVSPVLPEHVTINSVGVLTAINLVEVASDDTFTLTMQDEYSRQTSDTFTLEITAASSVAVISVENIGPQASNGDVPVSYTISADDSTVEAVIFAASEANPTAADFNGGGDPAYVDQGTVALTVSGGSSINLSITGTFNGSVKLGLLPTGGGDSDVAVSPSFNLDTTVPALSGVSGTQTGATTATWAVTSDEAGGVIYAAAYPTASSAPTAAQLIAGTGGSIVAANSDTTPTADGNNGGAFTGLTASTAYRVAAVHVDAVGNEGSVVTSAEFTTAAAPSGATFEGATSNTSFSSTPTYSSGTSGSTLPAVFTAGKKLIVIHEANGYVPTAVTVDGVAAVQRGTKDRSTFFYEATITGNTTNNIAITWNNGTNESAVGMYDVTGKTFQSDNVALYPNSASSYDHSYTFATAAGDAVIGGFLASASGTATGTTNLTGDVVDRAGVGTRRFSWYSNLNATGGSPETFIVTTNPTNAGQALELAHYA